MGILTFSQCAGWKPVNPYAVKCAISNHMPLLPEFCVSLTGREKIHLEYLPHRYILSLN